MIGVLDPSVTYPDHGVGSWTAREAMEQVILSALVKPRCVVDFSGGRDSSVVLAIASHVARREGLPLPVPFTRRFPEAPMAEESQWQELVIRHLRLPDWERREVTQELDLIGDRAQRFLRRYGLLLPAPIYHWTLSFELATGGSHLTGEGGDEMLSTYRARAALAALRSPRSLLHRSRAMSFLANVAPGSARAPLLRRTYASIYPLAHKQWMTPDAFSSFVERYAAQEASEPLSWRQALHWNISLRTVIAMKQNSGAIALDYDVKHLDPFFDATFVSALAQSRRTAGFVNRTQATSYLAGDLLPLKLLGRRSKAAFNNAYFAKMSRAFAETWDGSGVDSELVDAEALKREWLKPVPPGPSTALLQAAWMAQHGVPQVPVTANTSSPDSNEL